MLEGWWESSLDAGGGCFIWLWNAGRVRLGPFLESTWCLVLLGPVESFGSL